ncbi:MAG: FecR domain-containing protein [Candidatus Gracilibacteria bacterium]|jgi:hypothetical protein
MKLFNKILTIIMAFIVAFGVFFWENQLKQKAITQASSKKQVVLQVPDQQTIQLNSHGNAKSLQGPQTIELAQGDQIDTLQAGSAEIYFADFGVIRLNAATQLNFVYADTNTNNLVFDLRKGRVWGDTALTPANLNVIAGGAYLIPQHSSFDLDYDGEKVTIFAQKQHDFVGLVPLDHGFIQATSFKIPDFINTLFLAQGNQISIYNDQIQTNAETLKQLLYSKLLKEFRYGLYNMDTIESDSWISENIKKDIVLFQKSSSDLMKQFRDRGLIFNSLDSINFQLNQSYEKFSNGLVFDQSKLIQKVLNNFFDQVNDSEYLLMSNRQSEAQDRLNLFKKIVQESDLVYNDTYKRELIARLWVEYSKLNFVLPSDNLYPVRVVLSDLLLQNMGTSDAEIREKFLLVRDYLGNAYDIVDINPSVARTALDNYYKHFTALASKEQNRLSKVVDFFAQDNQIFDNLLRQYSVFYRDSYFAMKNNLEQQWLALLPEGDFKNEEKQTIISNKIDFLKRLQAFFLADKVSVVDARQIVFRLFKEADDLQLPVDAQVAVADLFAQRLQDFGVFYRYLNSQEFVGTTLHGTTHREQFDAFLQLQQKVNISDVQAEILTQANGQQLDQGAQIQQNPLLNMIQAGGQTQQVIVAPTQTQVTQESATQQQDTQVKTKVCRTCTNN